MIIYRELKEYLDTEPLYLLESFSFLEKGGGRGDGMKCCL